MAEKIYSMTLSDGTILTPLTLNGNNFVSKLPVTRETFAGKLDRVVVVGEATEDWPGLVGTHTNLRLENLKYVGSNVPGLDEGYYFVLGTWSDEELREMKLQADLEYLAMMTGVEL